VDFLARLPRYTLLAMSIAIQFASLTISALTLYYLIKYVQATDIIARQSVQQVEAAFRPALVALVPLSVDDSPKIVNIGNGPAMEIEWHLSTMESLCGTISYLEVNSASYSLQKVSGMKQFYHSSPSLPAIICNYKSISGAGYRSTSTYDVNRNEFSTVIVARSSNT
jgi:hypothetical protein